MNENEIKNGWDVLFAITGSPEFLIVMSYLTIEAVIGIPAWLELAAALTLLFGWYGFVTLADRFAANAIR